jgi:hypothetical protein
VVELFFVGFTAIAHMLSCTSANAMSVALALSKFYEEAHRQALARMTSRHSLLVKLCHIKVPTTAITHRYNHLTPASYILLCHHLSEDLLTTSFDVTMPNGSLGDTSSMLHFGKPASSKSHAPTWSTSF